MFDCIFSDESMGYLYTSIGVVGVYILLYLGKFIVKFTKTTKDDEFMEKLQEAHDRNIKREKEKAVDKIKNSLDN